VLSNATGAIVVIIVCSVLAVVIVIVVVVVVLRRRRRRALHNTQPDSQKQVELDSSTPYHGSASLAPSSANPDLSSFTSGLRREWLIPFSDLAFDAELGSGSFGKVWRGKLRQVTKVAIKQALLAGKQEQDLVAFRKEAELMLRMPPHPNVVQTLGVCSHEDSVYIVMELCPGGSVESKFRSGELDVKLKLSILVGLAKAMQHLHAHNICHRGTTASHRGFALEGN
jgi:hypothetical protein